MPEAGDAQETCRNNKKYSRFIDGIRRLHYVDIAAIYARAEELAS